MNVCVGVCVGGGGVYACVVLVMRVRTEKNGEKFPRIKLNTKLNVINYFYQNILSNACAFCSYAVKVVAICLVVETKLVGICFNFYSFMQ